MYLDIKQQTELEKEMLLQKKAIINHELKLNEGGLVMIVHKTLSEIPQKLLELAEQKCKNNDDYENSQCEFKCYEPFALENFSSYTLIIGIQSKKMNGFNKNNDVTIPMKNTMIYYDEGANFFGEKLILSSEDLNNVFMNDFEHEFLKSMKKNEPLKNHIKIFNQTSTCNYFNCRPKERNIYKLIKQKSLEYELSH